MNKVRKYEVWQPFILSAMVAFGMIVGVKMNTGSLDFVERISTEEAGGPIGRVEEVVRFIESKYVDSLDSDQILESAISDIMEDLDPHSIYLSAAQLNSINDQMNGYYRGIGIESFFIGDTVRISRVLNGTPAQKIGLQPFDKLIAIDDAIVAGKGLEYADIREMLKAENKEELNLTVIRGPNEDQIIVSVIPDQVNIQSSKVAYRIEDNIAYIKIDRFSSNTYREFMESLETLVDEQKTRHLIIDLRDNPGGYLPETVNIISQLFNEKGKLIVYTQGKSKKRVEYRTTGKNFFPIDKIAVLINEGSASGSEIIAGAVQDWDRGIIIGRRSFGKGLVQEQYPLKNGGAIRLTISRYYTPAGRSIQKSYENLDDYNNDIYERYHNGEVYGNSNYENGDSIKFYTQLLRRKVYGGGGISPDVYIPIDSTISIVEKREIYAYIPEFTFIQRENSKLENLTVSAFYDFLKPRGLSNLNNLMLNEDDLEKNIKSEWAYQTIDEVARDSILNENDPFVVEAVNYLKSELSLKDYSPELSRSEEY